jgi:hypothetical protein
LLAVTGVLDTCLAYNCAWHRAPALTARGPYAMVLLAPWIIRPWYPYLQNLPESMNINTKCNVKNRSTYYSTQPNPTHHMCWKIRPNPTQPNPTQPKHVLHKLLPPQRNVFNCYNLRKKTHDRQLPDKRNRLTNCNFMNRLLYVDFRF